MKKVRKISQAADDYAFKLVHDGASMAEGVVAAYAYMAAISFAEAFFPITTETMPEVMLDTEDLCKFREATETVLVLTSNGKVTTARRYRYRYRSGSEWRWSGSGTFASSIQGWRVINHKN